MESQSMKQDLIASEAADWFVRLQGKDVPESVKTHFANWLRQSPEHIQEYLSISEVWSDSLAVTEDCESMSELLMKAQLDEGDNVIAMPMAPVAEMAKKRDAAQVPGDQKRDPTRSYRKPIIGIAASLVVVIVAAVFWLVSEKGTSHSYITARGEQLTISLGDGSVVHLNAESNLRVAYDDHQRHMELRAGEARFHVAKDPKRPFLVATDRAQVRALGTIFNIYHRQRDTKVTVVEGRVEVRTNDARPRTELSAGQEVAVRPTGNLVKHAAVDMERVLAWTDRRFAFRSQRLGSVIAEFNRYNSPPIKIKDPALADLEISGAFRADDPQSLLQYLQRHEAVSVMRAPDGGVTLGYADDGQIP